MAGITNYWDAVYPMDPAFVIGKDDFYSTLSTLVWSTVKDSGASAAIVAGATNGTLALTSSATTDDDGALVQGISNFYVPAASKQMLIQTKVKLSDATQSDLFFGFATLAATNPEAILSSASRIGFEKLDGTAVLSAVTTASSVTTKSSCQISMVDDTFVELAILFDGTSAYFFVGGTQYQILSSTIPAAAMVPAMFSLSGSASGTLVSTWDYLAFSYQR